MAIKSKARRGHKTPASATGAVAATSTIQAWQDDPMSGLPPIARPVPQLSAPPLKFKIKGKATKPGTYQPGTAEFRYWTAAESLRRGGDFWAPLLGVKHWEPGSVLPVGLDEGTDLNAYYNRAELAFFHDTVAGQTVYSGESPDVVCHELGHACLDAIRPELFDAPFVEAAAFHESFGDMSAILSQLQLKGVRQAAIAGLKASKPSQLSRLAEQLGWAIRQQDPADVDTDCLRNASNSFDYIDPQGLPDSAPASKLCAEPHSFSRVFTGAFYDVLGGMLRTRSSNPTDADLAAIATDAGRLLVRAVTAAPVQPDYYAQVGSHLIDADTELFAGKYRQALVTPLVKRKIVPSSAVAMLSAFKGKAPAGGAFGMAVSTDRPNHMQVHQVRLSGQEFGIGDRPLIVEAPIETKPFLMVAAALLHKETSPTDVEQSARRFVKVLFAHDRVDARSGSQKMTAAIKAGGHRDLRRTHVTIDTPEGLRLVRRLFHCGCRC